MKKLLFLLMVLSVSISQAQNVEPTYQVDGEKVKVTNYYEDGSIESQGFFKNKKLEGKWTKYDRSGNKMVVGYYKDGKKVGTWFQWNEDTLRQINYQDNVIASVNVWKEDTKLAINKEK